MATIELRKILRDRKSYSWRNWKRCKSLKQIWSNKLSKGNSDSEEWGAQLETFLTEIEINNVGRLEWLKPQRRRRQKKKKNNENKMKRSSSNSKKNDKENNSGLSRKKSENSVNSRKNEERKKSNFKCKDATEKKGGTQLHQNKKVL